MDNINVPVWEWEDAVNFIAEGCNIDRDTIEKVLELELDYERSIGIILDEEESVMKESELTEKQEFHCVDGKQRLQALGIE